MLFYVRFVLLKWFVLHTIWRNVSRIVIHLGVQLYNSYTMHTNLYQITHTHTYAYIRVYISNQYMGEGGGWSSMTTTSAMLYVACRANVSVFVFCTMSHGNGVTKCYLSTSCCFFSSSSLSLQWYKHTDYVMCCTGYH